MKPIVVKDQVRLSAGRCLYLTLAGMYYRLTRSTITVAIIALAVAFLAYMLAYSVFVQERTYRASLELRRTRLLGEWVARLSAADPAPAVVAAVVAGDTARRGEYRRWAADAGTENLYTAAVEAFRPYREFLDYFAAMRPASRAVLLGDADPHDVPRLLCHREYRELFLRQTGELGLRPPLGGEGRLGEFLERDWPLVSAFLAAVRTGQVRAIERVRRMAAGRTLVEWMVLDPAGAIGAAIEAGYSPPGSEAVECLKEQALQSVREAALTRMISHQQARIAAARLLGVDQKDLDLDVLTQWISNRRRAAAFVRELAEISEAAELPPADELVSVARNYQRTVRLQESLGSELAPDRRGLAGVPQSTRWLIVVSFVVCAVGICNTMFMSVTERFTEIATMKCLGAMDGFMMLMFVFEAAIQGVAGSIVGVAVGFTLAALRGIATYGGLFFESVPVGSLGVIVVASVVLGVGLAAVSAVGPAWMAARLAPMEAMRVE